jgi:hypothetical protein
LSKQAHCNQLRNSKSRAWVMIDKADNDS